MRRPNARIALSLAQKYSSPSFRRARRAYQSSAAEFATIIRKTFLLFETLALSLPLFFLVFPFRPSNLVLFVGFFQTLAAPCAEKNTAK